MRLTKEEEFTKAFDAWADASKKLTIAEATHSRITYPLRRNPEGNALMNDVFLDMQEEIRTLRDRENDLAEKLRDATNVLKENPGDNA